MEDPRVAMSEKLKEAMKNKDTLTRDVIRMTMNAIKQVEIDTQKEVSAEDAASIVMKEAKKRRDTIQELVANGREDAAEAEKVELEIVERFLPKQLTREEIVDLVKKAIEESGATSSKEMGKVMGILAPKPKAKLTANSLTKWCASCYRANYVRVGRRVFRATPSYPLTTHSKRGAFARNCCGGGYLFCFHHLHSCVQNCLCGSLVGRVTGWCRRPAQYLCATLS